MPRNHRRREDEVKRISRDAGTRKQYVSSSRATEENFDTSGIVVEKENNEEDGPSGIVVKQEIETDEASGDFDTSGIVVKPEIEAVKLCFEYGMWPSRDLYHSLGSSPDGVDLPPAPPTYSHDGRTFKAKGIISENSSLTGYFDDSFQVEKKEIKSTYTGKIFDIAERDMFSAAAFLYVDGICMSVSDYYKTIYNESSRTVFLATSIEVAKEHCARIWMSSKDSFLETYLFSMAYGQFGQSSYITSYPHEYRTESQRFFTAVMERNKLLIKWFKDQGGYIDPESIPDSLIGSEHRLVGSLTYSTKTNNDGIRGINVEYVCVRKHYQHIGVGKYLMEHVSAKMKSSTEYHYIKLISLKKAKSFYEHIGYEDGVGGMFLHRCKETPKKMECKSWCDQHVCVPTSLGSESPSAPTSNLCKGMTFNVYGDDDDSPTSDLYDLNSATTSSAHNSDDTKIEYAGDYTKPPPYESNMDTPSPTEPLLRDTSGKIAAIEIKQIDLSKELLSDINNCKTSHSYHLRVYPPVRGMDNKKMFVHGIEMEKLFHAAAVLLDSNSDETDDGSLVKCYENMLGGRTKTVVALISNEEAKKRCLANWKQQNGTCDAEYKRHLSKLYSELKNNLIYDHDTNVQYVAKTLEEHINDVKKRNEKLKTFFESNTGIQAENIPDQFIGIEHRLIACVTYQLMLTGKDISVSKFATRQGFQHLDVGKSLMDHVIGFARDSEYNVIYLFNASADLADFYENMGFTRATKDDGDFKMNLGDEKNEKRKRKFEDDHSTSSGSDEETSYATKRAKYEETDNFAHAQYGYYHDSDDSDTE